MSSVSAGLAAAPELEFAVRGSRAHARAATPTIVLELGIERRSGQPVRALTASVRVDIAPARRRYEAAEQERLGELFGAPDQWEQTLGNLLWTRATVLTGPFSDDATVELPVPCSYDFDVAAAKYLDALQDGEIPLELMFSGTILYDHEAGCVRAAPIPWDREAGYRLPVALLRDAMRSVFGDSAWVRLPRATFDRLCRYRRERGSADWEQTIESLLRSCP